MSINWTVRFKNPVFWVQLVASAFIPVLAYMGITVQELTTWGEVLNVIVTAYTNPYVLLLVVASVLNTINDPTTSGITDSASALKYLKPNSVK